MNRLNCVAKVFLGLCVIGVGIFAGGQGNAARKADKTDKIEMYLCFDQAQMKENGDGGDGGNGKYVKMVYGYIDGRRTECMSEADFLSRYCVTAVVPKPPSMAEALSAPISSPMIRNYAKGDFREADLFGMDLRHANCQQADFFKADLRNANLQNADCKWANFEGAYLRNTDLSGADLSEANLKNAYLVSADLRNVKGLTLEIVRFAATLCNSKLDDELRDLVNQYCPSKWRDVSFNWGVPDDVKARARRRPSGR